MMLVVIVVVVVAAIGGVVISRGTASRPKPSRAASGTSLWVGIPIEERRYYLDDLLGQPWEEESYVVPDLKKTKLYGLSHAEVVEFLGPPRGGMVGRTDDLAYLLGDLREKAFGESVIDRIVPGFGIADYFIVIDFDPETGKVSKIRIGT